MPIELNVSQCLPQDVDDAILIGRVWDPAVGGPTPVMLRDGKLYDTTPLSATVSELLNGLPHPVSALRFAEDLPLVGAIEDVLANSDHSRRDETKPWLIAPCDLQVVKAGGVTFIASLLERVIEERALGDISKAEQLRESINSALGGDLKNIVPGSVEAAHLKQLLIERGIWSQYLEVAIGPDSEVFTKTACLHAVGVGAEVGIYSKSTWNNPEPEVVLAVNARGQVVGAALGNDVNLRDFEGRSALLLSKAKDNNASCALGPFIRLFDERFTFDTVRQLEIRMEVEGEDAFHMEAVSAMSMISRDPQIIVDQTIGKHHQYPDGFVLFLGTMFAPVVDRDEKGKGFTHKVGDVVRISSPALGTLVNRVNHSEAIAPWTFGLSAFMHNLAKRGLLGR
ncbi:MAG: fumarylacetoacetate hydrolase family protein [Bryobacterales bacterium]|jgi:fumarylacetoacetate (FAA) hydrolase family protein|nr:fumarylacetoacetate hydrolase family protein [Bryobacterales bacterium]